MSGDEMKPLSARDRRYSVINVKWSSTLLKEEGEPSTSTEQGEPSTMVQVYTDKGEPSTSTLTDQDEPSTWPGPSGTEDTFVQAIDQTSTRENTKDGWCQTVEVACKNCTKLKSELLRLKQTIQYYQSKLNFYDEKFCDDHDVGTISTTHDDSEDNDDDAGDTDSEDDSNDDDLLEPSSQTETEEEPIMVDETVSSDTEPEDENVTYGNSIFASNENLMMEPKFVVFLSQLLELFKVCATCKKPDVLVEVKEFRTMVQVETACNNKRCSERNIVWKSQPLMPGTLTSAGNLLLSFAILVAGGSASKTIRIFEHMGLGCISLPTFFRHQRTKLFPAIHLHWSSYQSLLCSEVEDEKKIVLSGDGRHDSMGHSAKYCAYSLFCHDPLNAIIDFSLVQRNEAGSSPAMEYMAFTKCLDNISKKDLAMDTFVSDRHSSIAKHMREKLPMVTHYFDLWHLVKKVSKVLNKIAKEKGCEELLPWIKPCVNHLYWSATTTEDGNGDVIWAKFESFLEHITNVHSNLPNPVFNKCAHGEDIAERTWLNKDSALYEKLRIAILNKRLKKGICQASPLSQTSCLEGFHSVLNHFSPKMIAYSFQGMYCRHILAVCHFNTNLKRDEQTTESGEVQVKVVYPKFKNGEATVRSVRVLPNFVPIQQPTPAPQAQKKERAKPCCRECGNRMKHHDKIKDCPRNKK